MATRIEAVWADSRRLAEIQSLQPGSMKLVHLAPGKPVDLYAGLDDKLRALLSEDGEHADLRHSHCDYSNIG